MGNAVRIPEDKIARKKALCPRGGLGPIVNINMYKKIKPYPTKSWVLKLFIPTMITKNPIFNVHFD